MTLQYTLIIASSSVWEFSTGEEKFLAKRKEESKIEERIVPNLMGGFIFLHNTKSPNSGEIKKCIGMRILVGLEYLQVLYICYNTLKIKNTLIISTLLSIYSNTLPNKVEDFPLFPSHLSPPNSQIET
jgi:hypothetical protein